MDTYKTFISEADQLEKNFQLIQQKGTPKIFNQELLQSIGLNEPNTVFYVKLFKVIGLIDEEGRPIKSYYSRFAGSDNEARLVIGERLPEVYSEIYEADKYAYKLNDEQLYDLFQQQMKKGKSATFVRLVANTYRALALYAEKGEKKEQQMEKAFAGQQNGHQKNGQVHSKYQRIDIEEANNPNEEFLIELLNGCSTHEYRKDTYSTDESEESVDEIIDKQLGKEVTDEKKLDEEQLRENKSDHNKEDDPAQSYKFTSLDANKSQKVPLHEPAGEEDIEKHRSLFSKTLVKRAELLVQMNRRDEAVSAFNDIINFFAKENYPIGIGNVSSAFYKKGCLLEEMGNFEKALETFDEFISNCNEEFQS